VSDRRRIRCRTSPLPGTTGALVLVVTAVTALSRLPAAGAYDSPARLNEVAHVYSLGRGEVRCPSGAEWDAYYGSAFAWGSTNLREDFSLLAPAMCEGGAERGQLGGAARYRDESCRAPLWMPPGL
jgi:hypothetical protein